MTFKFPIGDGERHEVIIELFSSLEFLRVTIDGEPAIWDFRLVPFLPLRFVRKKGLATGYRFSAPFFSRYVHYSFIVGHEERHKVRIQQETNPWLGDLRKEQFRIFVDEALVEEQEG